MRWQLGRKSSNVEDRRGMSPTRGFPMPGGVTVRAACAGAGSAASG